MNGTAIIVLKIAISESIDKLTELQCFDVLEALNGQYGYPTIHQLLLRSFSQKIAIAMPIIQQNEKHDHESENGHQSINNINNKNCTQLRRLDRIEYYYIHSVVVMVSIYLNIFLSKWFYLKKIE